MVAKIKRGASLSRNLNYNEQKVQREEAECIHAVNYPKDLEDLSFYNKLHRLEYQAALNEEVKVKSVHISLNFDESDKLDRTRLQAISESYMRQIGFGNQPYLVYEHLDAGHQHVHIVTTNIRSDGSKIDMNNIGRNQSEAARKNIEQVYNLVQAEGQRNRRHEGLAPISVQKVLYGQHQTKQAIANVLEHVIKNYNFTSLGELNAILKGYNVTADPGEKDSRLRQFKGLYYRVLDENGNKIGAPIKGSAFYNKPTLKNLERRYAQNQVIRPALAKGLKTKIDWALRGGNVSLPDLKRALEQENIKMVIRHNDQGMAYGVTFVDLKKRCAINGSELGKEYSAKGLEERCRQTPKIPPTNTLPGEIRPLPQRRKAAMPDKGKEEPVSGLSIPSPSNRESIWEALIKPELQQDVLPYELTHDMKKKKKPKLRH